MLSQIRSTLHDANTLRKNRGTDTLLINAVGTVWEKSVRRLLPTSDYLRMNGVRIGSEYHRYHLLDKWVPWPTPWNPNWEVDFSEYKENTTKLIQEYIESGDSVCIIGGGYGVSAVKTSEVVGDTGQVIVYEAAKERFDDLTKTIELKGASNVDCRHALVGPDVAVAGDFEQAKVVKSGDLPETDVIEMDCEGAELSILNSLSKKPRLIIVETHPEMGVTTTEVRNVLIDSGYEIREEVNDRVSGSIITAEKGN